MKAAVLGGEGFVGNEIVKALLEKKYEATSIGPTQRHFEDDRTFIKFDITNYRSVYSALEKCKPEVVFHTVSPHEDASDELARSVNIRGTTNVVEACRELEIPALVYTSSFTVVGQLCEMIEIDETHPYAAVPITIYADSKITAEKIVLAANGHGLLTVALRPFSITGPGDRQYIKGCIDVYKEGNSWVQIGDGNNCIDSIDVRDLANVHVQAAEKLQTSAEGVAGEAFFVAGPDRLPFWEGPRLIWKLYANHEPRFTCKMPAIVAYYLAMLFEFFGWLFNKQVAMNRRNIVYASRTMTISSAKARSRLGFNPQITARQSIRESVEHLLATEARERKST